MTKPVISADTHGYSGGWTNQTVTVDSFACADTGSVQSGVNNNSVGGGQTISTDTPAAGTDVSNTGGCDDNAGNVASAKTVNVKVDKTDPNITASGKKADNTAYASGDWTNQDVTVHYTCSDALSGLAAVNGCPADQTLPRGHARVRHGRLRYRPRTTPATSTRATPST